MTPNSNIHGSKNMHLRIAIAAFLATSLATPAFAQLSGTGLVSEIQAKRNGLERVWFSQIQLDPGRSRVAGLMLHVSSSHAMTTYEINHKGGRVRFASNQFDHLGREIGDEGAKDLAERNMLLLKAAGLEPKLERRVRPEITLYGSSDRGMIHAIDGETGRTKWEAIIGNPHHPTLAPSANDRYVAAVNGSNLFLLDRNTGRQLWRRKVVSAPGAGPALSEEMAFVPMVNGKMESFVLSNFKRPPGVFQAIGRSLVKPILTPRSVAWPTDRGHLYVAPSHKKGIRYRIEARNTIVAPASFQAPYTLFTASIDGYVYSIHEVSGRLNWSYSIGEQISHTPIPLGKNLLVVTDNNRMYALSVETGEPVWMTEQIRGYVSASQDRIYAINTLGRLTILNRDSGALISTLPTEELDMLFINKLTDRIYIGTKRGLIQCLREPRNEFPLLHQDEAAKAEEDGKEVAPDTVKEGENPFDAAPAKDEKDENPFGAPPAKDKKDENPFGAKKDENPFGM
jgi:outer membrane protein assembly factor BamB